MPAPRRLVNPEEDEEEDGDEPDGMDTDTFLQQLAGTKLIMPKCVLYASEAARPVKIVLDKVLTCHYYLYLHVSA